MRLAAALGLLTLALLSSGLAAAPPGAVQASFSRPWVWGVDRLAFRRHVDMANQLNYYRLDVVQWQAEKNRPPSVNFWLHEPRGYGSFSRPVSDFFQMTVNDIPLKELHLDERSVELLPADAAGRAGCAVALNYDGARFRLEWTMRPDSALLHGRLTPELPVLTPVRSVRIRLLCVPSTLRKDASNKVLYGGVYAREALTPVRTLGQHQAPQPLTPADAYLIIQDRDLAGGGEEMGAGPCLFTCSFDSVENATLNMADSWLTTLDITLKPDFNIFRFALWQHKTPFTNSEFQNLFRQQPERFRLD